MQAVRTREEVPPRGAARRHSVRHRVPRSKAVWLTSLISGAAGCANVSVTHYHPFRYAQCLRDSPDIVSDEVRRSGHWPDCDDLTDLWRDSSPSAVIVDVGANVGSCTLRMVATGVFTHAFEPLLANARMLEASLLANGWSERAIVHHVALGHRPGAARLYSQVGNAGNTVVGHPTRDSAKASMHAAGFIRTETLDRVLWRDAAHPSPRIPLLKIDAQGMELHVLRGARRLLSAGAVQAIQMELAPHWLRAQNVSVRDVIDFLHLNHFSVTDRRGSYLNAESVDANRSPLNILNVVARRTVRSAW